MRKAYQDKQILRDDDGTLVGIAFGFDFCCEHECGTDRIYQNFGIPGPGPKVQGLKARTVTKFDPGNLVREKEGKDHYLIWDEYFYPYSVENAKEVLAPPKWKGAREDDVLWSSAWTSGPGKVSFGLRFRGDSSVLDELEGAFKRKDIAIWTATALGLMGRGGLVLAIASRVPKVHADHMIELDLEHLALLKAAKKSGIEKKLKKAGKSFLALSPKKLPEHKKSKYPVQFCLNPLDRDAEWGFYTVEELEQWIQGKGPVVKVPKIPDTEATLKESSPKEPLDKEKKAFDVWKSLMGVLKL